VFARVFKGEGAELEELCLGATCLNEQQLRSLLRASAAGTPSSGEAPRAPAAPQRRAPLRTLGPLRLQMWPNRSPSRRKQPNSHQPHRQQQTTTTLSSPTMRRSYPAINDLGALEDPLTWPIAPVVRRD
jgi:hypothetical protein